MNRTQVPGRAEALREVVRQGVANASPELQRLAGMDRRFPPRPRETNIQTRTFTSGIENLNQAERDALPF